MTFLLAVLLAATADAQSVLPDDPVYSLLDKLVAAHVIAPATLSHRPLSEQRVKSLIDDALSHIAPNDSSILARQTREARRTFAPIDSLRRRLTLSRTEFDLRHAQSPSRTIQPDADGSIDVELNPLLSNRLGVPPTDHNLSTERAGFAYRFSAHFDVTGGVAIFEPFRHDEQSDRLDLLNLRALFGNLSITIGRDNQFFGQGLYAGLTNSLNPPSFDLVRIQNEEPFHLPWLLRLLGPIDATAYLADLGGHQEFPHSRLFSYKLTAHPFSSIEVGATVADQVGGQGAPGGTFLEKVEDAVPLLDATLLHRTLRFSNKFVGVDGRVLLPGSRGLQAYTEIVFDDFDLRRLESSLTQDAGFIYGLSADCLVQCGRLRVVSEYHSTGLRYYTHTPFTTGYTLDRQFIGDQLGPRGQGGYLQLDLGGTRHRVALNSAYEIRSGDKWGATSTTANDSDFHFVLLEHHPAERRWRSLLSYALINRPSERWTLSGGGERVQNFNFQPGWRTNGLIEVSMTNWFHGKIAQ